VHVFASTEKAESTDFVQSNVTPNGRNRKSSPRRLEARSRREPGSKEGFEAKRLPLMSIGFMTSLDLLCLECDLDILV